MDDTPSAPCLTTGRRGSYDAAVVANDLLCREHFHLRLRVESFPETLPGQFVQLQAADEPQAGEPIAANWFPGDVLPGLRNTAADALLNRPFSLAGRQDEGGGATLEIIYRVVGPATHWLETLRAGRAAIHLIGPLGRSFTPPAGRTAILVGGGVGIPPMIYCAKAFGPSAIAICGATTRELLPLRLTFEPDQQAVDPTLCAEAFNAFGVRTLVTSDDGSVGKRGYVTDALRNVLHSAAIGPAKVYACGPEAMLKRVAEIAAEFAAPCEVAVERSMACGLGTCQSCVIRVTDGDAWKYQLACTDGPVFDAATLRW